MEENIRNREFLGQGLAFPLQVNSRGEIALARGEVDIEQSIRIILATSPGERVMRPEFGCRARELLFAPINPSTEATMAFFVQESLTRWEPRIELIDVKAGRDPAHDGALLVDIRYRIKDTHDERSIVYPFFLMGEEEE